MMIIVCDMCKKPVQNAVREKNYFTFQHHDLCRSCYKKLRNEVQDVMEGRIDANKTYTLADHNQVFVSTLERYCK
jgi:hypothetical protein